MGNKFNKHDAWVTIEGKKYKGFRPLMGNKFNKQ